MTQRPRQTFLSVELDPIDARLEAKAVERGIPTLVSPKPEPAAADKPAQASPSPSPAGGRRANVSGQGAEATPRTRMRGLKIELPDYVWVAVKTRAAEKMVSLRHVIMTALRAQGIAIKDADMIEDGRRLRGPDGGTPN